jgi:hypothetical protein
MSTPAQGCDWFCLPGVMLRGESMSPGNVAARKKTPPSSGDKWQPIGLDIGTANIVVYMDDRPDAGVQMEANAFFTVPSMPNTRKILEDKAVPFFEKENCLHILGTAAEEFSNILGGATRRPMENGLVNLREDDGIHVIQAILDPMVPEPVQKDHPLWFSVPGDPIDRQGAVIFNESIFKTYLKGRGYMPRPINEAMAVVMSELSDQHATGIGISMGGGMCNVCFSYLSIPAVTYSIQKGGDFIDQTVGRSVGESATKIKSIKEQALDLGVPPRNNIEHGLHAAYDDLFATLAASLVKGLSGSDNMPRLSQAVPIVLSGGTVLPPGSRERFETILDEIDLPIRISTVMQARDPLYATAKGAYLMAAADES